MSKFNTILIWIAVIAIVGGVSYMVNLMLENPPLEPITVDYVMGAYAELKDPPPPIESEVESAPTPLEELLSDIPEDDQREIESGVKREKPFVPQDAIWEAKVYDYQLLSPPGEAKEKTIAATLKLNGSTYTVREGQALTIEGVPAQITVVELAQHSVTLAIGEHSETWVNKKKSPYWDCPDLNKQDRYKSRAYGG